MRSSSRGWNNVKHYVINIEKNLHVEQFVFLTADRWLGKSHKVKSEPFALTFSETARRPLTEEPFSSNTSCTGVDIVCGWVCVWCKPILVKHGNHDNKAVWQNTSMFLSLLCPHSLRITTTCGEIRHKGCSRESLVLFLSEQEQICKQGVADILTH